MADSAPAPNNRAVIYRGRSEREKPRTMPAVSKAQNAAMQAAAAGKSTLGIPAAVGRELTADQAPGSVKELPARAAHKRINRLRKAGAISEGARKKMPSKYQDGDTPKLDATTA